MVWTMEGSGKYLATYGVVSAPDEKTARERIDAELQRHRLDPGKVGYTMKKLKPNTAVLLSDGDY